AFSACVCQTFRPVTTAAFSINDQASDPAIILGPSRARAPVNSARLNWDYVSPCRRRRLLPRK
ncbi:MAG: hypothetical protein LBD77_08495, partial [Bifidobacteriaceae bacterium]|nr:hypothetical protein [Bifidobacteriaceae bacterium]